jgi:hypothetical protein
MLLLIVFADALDTVDSPRKDRRGRTTGHGPDKESLDEEEEEEAEAEA